jgi:hypothetical protein
MFDTKEHELVTRGLREAREQTLRKLGRLSSNVIGRNLSNYKDPRPYLWPSSAMGAIRLVQRDTSVLFITDGISDPWDRTLHTDAPPGTFDYELAIEVPNSSFKSLAEDKLASSWAPTVLIAATDGLIGSRYDLAAVLIKLGCATIGIPKVSELESFMYKDGWMRGLVGIPLQGEPGTSVCLAKNGQLPIYLLTMKLLSCDEIDYALQNDQANALDLVSRFVKRGDRHLTWIKRPSVLREPVLK